MEKSQSDPRAGILWMLATGFCFVGVNGVVHHLGTDLPSPQSAFIRFLYGLVFLAPALVQLARRGLPEGTVRLVLLRGVLHTAAVILWFYAMARVPVADVTAIGYLNPIVVTLGGILLFGERMTGTRALALVVALAGALIVLRPGLREVLPGHLAQLGAALCFGLSYLVAKRLAGVIPAGALVAILSLTVTVGLAPLAIAVWVPPTLVQVLWLGVVAAFATGGHYCMARAFAAAPLTVTQPVTFLQLVWATLLGATVFGEAIDPWVLVGGGVIIAAIMALSLQEARAGRAAAAAATPD